MPLLLRTLEFNDRLDFYLLSDLRPPAALPKNVHALNCTLDALYQRLARTVGLQLPGGSAVLKAQARRTGKGFMAGRDISESKVNDLKPMWGTAFAEDLLVGYDWWGYLQDDVLLGNLSASRGIAASRELASADVISPYPAPYNTSGVFMLFRNTPRVNSLWRRSADVPRVLSDPTYLCFDEWWGASADNMAAVRAGGV